MEVHIVQKGDTLWKISRQYGVSFEELKKVNAHLANPDYIVPGMKIFLPAKVKKAEHHHVKPEHHHEKKETKPPKVKKPIPLPPTVVEEEITVEVPIQAPPPIPPIPMPPPVEQPIPFPVESPCPPESPIMMPQPYPVPMPMPVPQYTQPYGYVPCGWMPIYDADCYPYMYGGTHHQAPSYATQMPMPPIPMYDMEEASPVEVMEEVEEMEEIPMQKPRPEGWKMIESPEFMTEEFTLPVEEEPFAPESIAPLQTQPYYESPEMYPQYPTYGSVMPIYGSTCNCGSAYPTTAPAYTHNLCGSCHQPMYVNPYYRMNSPTYCSICHGYH